MNSAGSGLRVLSPLIWTALWLMLVAVTLAIRPAIAVSETRYLAVAWEMWRDGNYWVPHLNGAPHSHNPPLLFWLINLGWAVFGVNDWWPRLVAPLFSLAALFLTWRLAYRLWPVSGGDDRSRWLAVETALTAPLLLIGGLLWACYTPATMFEMILVCFALIGLGAIVRAWRSGSLAGFVVLGLAIGLGVLTKGPAILVYVMPAALLAPLWAPRLTEGVRAWTWRSWYLGIGAALLLGGAIGLAWAVPAGLLGGGAYRDEIFWGQHAGRLIGSGAHQRPWWWYFAALALMLVPLSLWPRLWYVGGRSLLRLGDGGVRFCLLWFVSAFVLFSLISDKQPHDMLPILPALALLLARGLADLEAETWWEPAPTVAEVPAGPDAAVDSTPEPGDDNGSVPVSGRVRVREDAVAPAPVRVPPRTLLLPAGTLGLLAVALVPLPWIAGGLEIPGLGVQLAGHLESWWMLLPAVLALLLAVSRPRRSWSAVAQLSICLVFGLLVLHVSARPMLDAFYDVRPLATKVRSLQEAGAALAYYGKYQGQFSFLGRLQDPLDSIVEADGVPGRAAILAWLGEHPDGMVIAASRRLPEQPRPLFVQPFRSRYLLIWHGETLAARPELASEGMRVLDKP